MKNKVIDPTLQDRVNKIMEKICPKNRHEDPWGNNRKLIQELEALGHTNVESSVTNGVVKVDGPNNTRLIAAW